MFVCVFSAICIYKNDVWSKPGGVNLSASYCAAPGPISWGECDIKGRGINHGGFHPESHLRVQITARGVYFNSVHKHCLESGLSPISHSCYPKTGSELQSYSGSVLRHGAPWASGTFRKVATPGRFFFKPLYLGVIMGAQALPGYNLEH